MPDPAITLLREERARVYTAYHDFLNEAKKSKRFDSVDEQTSDRYQAELEALTARIDAAEARQARQSDPAWQKQRAMVEAITGVNVTEEGRPFRGGGDDLDSQFRQLLRGELRSIDAPLNGLSIHILPDGRHEVRSLGTTSTAIGGALIGAGFSKRLYEYLVDSSTIMRAGPTVLNTEGGAALQIPRVDSVGTAVITGEGTAISSVEASFGTVQMGAWKHSALVTCSRELVEDAGVDLLGFLSRDVGRSLGDLAGRGFVVGSGTNQAHGLMPSATVGVTGGTGQAGCPTASEMIDLLFAVNPRYQQRGCWLTSSANWAKALKLVDKNDRPLISLDTLAVGAPSTLMGRPIYLDSNVASCGTGALSWAFFDPEGYYVRSAGPIRFDTSTDVFFTTDMTAFRGIWRCDGALIDSHSARTYKGGSA